jgi:hypothetical protein
LLALSLATAPDAEVRPTDADADAVLGEVGVIEDVDGPPGRIVAAEEGIAAAVLAEQANGVQAGVLAGGALPFEERHQGGKVRRGLALRRGVAVGRPDAVVPGG